MRSPCRTLAWQFLFYSWLVIITEAVSNFQFGVHVPENCEVRLIGALRGKKKMLTWLILKRTGMCPVKMHLRLRNLILILQYLPQHERADWKQRQFWMHWDENENFSWFNKSWRCSASQLQCCPTLKAWEKTPKMASKKFVPFYPFFFLVWNKSTITNFSSAVVCLFSRCLNSDV